MDELDAEGGGDSPTETLGGESELIERPDNYVTADAESDDVNVPPNIAAPMPCDGARHANCADYKLGKCLPTAQCHHEHHNHVTFPSSGDWEDHHVQRLHFQCHALDTDCSELSVNEVISNWLISRPDSISDNDYLPYCPARFELEARIANKLTDLQKYRRLLPRQIAEDLQHDEFLSLLVEFASKYNMQTAHIPTLCRDLVKQDNCPSAKKHHSKYKGALLRWVYTLKECRRGTLSEVSFNQLLADIAEVAALETNCAPMVQNRDGTACQITLCSQSINVQSALEVWSGDGDGVFQVITFPGNKIYSRPIHLSKVLPQIACTALANAHNTPFGNGIYKTVYQLSVHAVRSSENAAMEVHVVLVKCHVSYDALEKTVKCPISKSIRPSYIIYERLPSKTLHDADIISLIYKAARAVLITFKGFELDEVDDDM
ncbi:uncharacterized protein [Ptychodera flava]|uniref:uncharacterized protein n=1 Tax=Ptychodera flava TaxID=63121 RepID=UPI00396A8920